MRRLVILLVGASRALNEARRVLEQYGHDLMPLDAALGQGISPVIDVLIEDGSVPVPAGATDALRMSLRLCAGPLTEHGLPTLQLRCYDRTRRLLAVLDIPGEPSGNGQRLRQRAVTELADWVALLVSCFSRDARHFSPTTVAPFPQEQSLQGLESLAYLHRHNRTADPQLLHQAQELMIERLQASLDTFAERPALTIDDLTLSYRQLHLRSLAIQQRLLPLLDTQMTRTTPCTVGLCLGKSAALYASILAILGCGAVYVPMEPGYPLPRQYAMLRDANISVLLDDGNHPLRDRFVSLDVSTIEALPAATPHGLIRHRPRADAPCVVLYTSGTTGQPKGVLLSQYNLAHFTAWFATHVQLNQYGRVLQFSSLGFDSSLMDIFPTLIQGAELIVPNEDQRRDPAQLSELIRRQRVSHAFLPPALLSILPVDEPLGLVHLLTGGDTCEPHVIERLAGQCRFHNLYGPTEATVLVTARTLQVGDGNRMLGAPIANCQVLILDEAFQPVDEQVTGELYIVGPGVSLGYLNDPEQTAQHYVQLSLPDGRNLPAYRSGDMAKWTDQGVELGGRRDDQVKIRGFRVEPYEIEHCLRSSQLFRQVAVVVDPDRRVLAFVAQPDPAYPHASLLTLKQHARGSLPDYMQPSAYTELVSLPCLCNGKIDRQALLALPTQPRTETARHPAQTVEQARLLALWSELLALPVSELSIDESFFNLGGHSILLSTMLLRIREQFGRSVSLGRFIEVPTIRTLAALLANDIPADAPISQAARDARRELDIPVLPADRPGDRQYVIVTGANSFVGVHFVEAMLAAGAQEVACLVRESSEQSAQSRFTEALRTYRLEHLDLRRVRVYAADISQPRLGLPAATYEYLARQYGVLLHNAAHVNHVMDYAVLAKDNVEPIFECLRLCETHCKKVFNFISTLSASSSIDAQGYVLESHAASTPPLYIRNGYNLSKWVAERLLGRAAEQGSWVNIYRPGNITFNSRNGVCQPQKNRLMLMLKGSLQLGLVPRFALNFDLMPVDFLARFVAFHCPLVDVQRNVFNLHNPQPLSWDDYIESFRQAGHSFDLVNISDWQHQLRRVDSDNALFGVLGFYLDGLEEDIGDISMIRHDNARWGVEQMGAQYPEKTPALLGKGCDYLSSIGFL